jgi:uncharacterized protein YdhG (YjbR/CyaY superfamily)
MIKDDEITSVDAYIRNHPAAVRKRLKEIQSIVKTIAPSATERLSYRMPAFFLNGLVVYFAAFKNHIGLYPGADGVAAFQGEITSYKSAKGSIQFPHDQPLPVDLIKRIVKYKVKTNLEQRKKRGKPNCT